MPTTEDTAAPARLEALVTMAFQVAKQRGKDDWRRMTVAVLKNRLLQLSHGAFHEQHYGASSFRELLMRHPHIVLVKDGWVELVDHEAPAPQSHRTGPGTRIRADLWRALIDYSSGHRYAWDESSEVARIATDADREFLPTLSATEMASWRADFVSLHGSTPTLIEWRDEARGSNALPAEFKGEWSAFVRGRVAARIDTWFTARGGKRPELIVATETHPAPTPTVEKLRRLVAACVAVMTEEELAGISLSPAIVVRAQMAGQLR